MSSAKASNKSQQQSDAEAELSKCSPGMYVAAPASLWGPEWAEEVYGKDLWQSAVCWGVVKSLNASKSKVTIQFPGWERLEVLELTKIKVILSYCNPPRHFA
jgi:hypothetical protein